jgi:hypothetical protein
VAGKVEDDLKVGRGTAAALCGSLVCCWQGCLDSSTCSCLLSIQQLLQEYIADVAHLEDDLKVGRQHHRACMRHTCTLTFSRYSSTVLCVKSSI